MANIEVELVFDPGVAMAALDTVVMDFDPDDRDCQELADMATQDGFELSVIWKVVIQYVGRVPDGGEHDEPFWTIVMEVDVEEMTVMAIFVDEAVATILVDDFDDEELYEDDESR